MRIKLTDEQQSLQQSLRRLFTDTCATSTGRVDRGPGVRARVLGALADSGMVGLPLPEKFGGAGAGLVETGLLFHEGGRALCPSGVYSTVLAGMAMAMLGDDVTAGRWVPELAAGKATAAVALWSPEDARSLRPVLRARRDRHRLLLNGTVRFVENAGDTDHLVVTAEETSGRWVLAVVDPRHDGVHQQPVQMLGRDPVAHVTLQDVPAEAIAAPTSARLTQLAQSSVALQCMEMVGGTERVLEDTVAYVARREQFGRPVGSFQAVQHIVADLRIKLDGARLAAWHAVWHVGMGRPGAREVAIAKLWCSEAYKTATLQCHQLTGGMGFLRESDLHLWSERAKVCEIRNGSPDVALDWISAENDVR